MLCKYLTKTVNFLEEDKGSEIILINNFRKPIFQLKLRIMVFMNEKKFYSDICFIQMIKRPC